MAVPGGNLLATALACIDCEAFSVYRFAGKTVNAIGLDVLTYSDPIETFGSIQPVDRNQYSDLGLDFAKRHIQVWTESEVDDLYRMQAGDHIAWDGRRWEVSSKVNWFPIDGWNSVVATQVPPP